MDLYLTKERKEILSHPARFKVITAGRRFGKSILGLMFLLKGEMLPGENRWYLSPTYRQGKLTVWPLLKSVIRNQPDWKINETELSCTRSGATIAIKGSDSADSLRGAELQRCVLDEYAYQKSGVFEEIIYPMLTTTNGNVMMIGTPDGFSANNFYDYFVKGQGADPLWKSWQFKTIDGGFVSDKELELAKSNLDSRAYRQEFLATFESAANRAAWAFERSEHVKTAEELSPNKIIGLDFNIDYMTAVLCSVFSDGTIHFEDEIRRSNCSTEMMAIEMTKKWPGIYNIFPDPAGTARSTTSSRSDHQVLRDHNYFVTARRRHPSHRDRLNALNRKLRDATGKIGMTIDPKCIYLIKDLEQVQRDQKGGIAKDNIELSHALDACSYLIEYKWPIVQRIATSINWN
tara:strand:+ start:6363 stop:7574 length:1212 start_codon:yes stop_codon:yes gene_type:complete